ncbi:MAG: aldo/keto reductase [Aestuariivita sp.]|nr:aldo/keto reductase [Aestuariivita sp.]
MERRKLLTDGTMTSEIGLGCMSFSGFYGATSEKEAHETLAFCLDHGLDFLDTANIYGNGISEKIIGNFIKKTSGKFFIATKGGIARNSQDGRRFDNRPKFLRSELENSLKRLNTDSLDLFYVHRRDPGVEIENVMETLLEFKAEGKIRGVGFSEISPTSLRRAAAIGPVDAVQSEYSLWTRSPELGLIQACKELGASFIPFSPVGRGILTDTVPDINAFKDPDIRKNIPRFRQPNFAENLRKVTAFKRLAADLNVPTATLSLAWVLDQAEHVIPIPGTRSATHAAHFINASDFKMTSEIRDKIDQVLPVGWAYGDRYSENQWIGVERYA